MNSFDYLVCGGQHIAGMEAEYLFPLIKGKKIKYFIHGADSLRGSSVACYLKNPLVESTVDESSLIAKQKIEPVLKDLRVDNFPGLRMFIQAKVRQRLEYFSRYFKINDQLVTTTLELIAQQRDSQITDLIAQVQNNGVEVNCLSSFYQAFEVLNGQLGDQDKWWLVEYQATPGMWVRCKNQGSRLISTTESFLFPTAEPMFYGLCLLSAGLLTPHFPWYYEQDFLPQLQARGLLPKRYVVEFTDQIRKIPVSLEDKSFLPAWVDQELTLGELLWLSTSLAREYLGLDELLAVCQGKNLSAELFLSRFFPSQLPADQRRRYLKQAGGGLTFLAKLLDKNPLFKSYRLADSIRWLTTAKQALPGYGRAAEVYPGLGLAERLFFQQLEKLVAEIMLVGQIAKTVKNYWSYLEWRLVGIDPQVIADSLTIISVPDWLQARNIN